MAAQPDTGATKWSLARGRPAVESGSGATPGPVSGEQTIWNEVAELYGAGRSPFASFAERLVDRARLERGETVLDLGCGNGLALVHAAAAVAPGRALGVDFSEGMLVAAARRVQSAGLSNAELRRMDVRALELADASFDAALASSVLQFVGYSIDVLREWRRVLRSGGRLVFSVPRPAGDLALPTQLVTEFFPRLPRDVRQRLLPVPPPPLPDLPTLCRKAAFKEADVTVEVFPFTLPSCEAWWELQWTHGIRGFLRQLDPSTLVEFKAAAFERLASARLPSGELPGTATFTLCVARA